MYCALKLRVQCFILTLIIKVNANPITYTNLGLIIGTTSQTSDGREIESYKAIRYAQPPIGERRFKAPEPITRKWFGIIDATGKIPSCPDPYLNETEYSEDCLMLNVFTPSKDKRTKLPVIVYFFAGSFIHAVPSVENTGPQYLLNEDVVLVVPNYRTGALGFISTGDSEAPGNNGLKDQVMALRWVKENIEAFGGDPNLVTIMGYSAGGISVTLHFVSPLSKGLFHRGIVMSGSAFGPFPVLNEQLDLVNKLASSLGCPTNISRNIIACLKTKTAKEIANYGYYSLLEFGNLPVATWLSVVEPANTSKPFLTKSPMKYLANGELARVPILAGINSYELISFAYVVVGSQSLLNQINNDFETIAPVTFLYPKETPSRISRKLKAFYFNNSSIDISTVDSLEKIYSDSLVGLGVNRVVKLFSNQSIPVYYYNFNYKGRYSYFTIPDSIIQPNRPSHLDELLYLFYNPVFPMFTSKDPDYIIMKRMVSLWTNFARTGEPVSKYNEDFINATWNPYCINNLYMNISEVMVNDNGALRESRYNMWDGFFPVN